MRLSSFTKVIIREDYDDYEEEEEIVYVTDSEDEDDDGEDKRKRKLQKQTEDKKMSQSSLILTRSLAVALRLINEQKVSHYGTGLGPSSKA